MGSDIGKEFYWGKYVVESGITRDIASLARDYITYLILNSYQHVFHLAIKAKILKKYFHVSNLSSVAFILLIILALILHNYNITSMSNLLSFRAEHMIPLITIG